MSILSIMVHTYITTHNLSNAFALIVQYSTF